MNCYTQWPQWHVLPSQVTEWQIWISYKKKCFLLMLKRLLLALKSSSGAPGICQLHISLKPFQTQFRHVKYIITWNYFIFCVKAKNDRFLRDAQSLKAELSVIDNFTVFSPPMVSGLWFPHLNMCCHWKTVKIIKLWCFQLPLKSCKCKNIKANYNSTTTRLSGEIHSSSGDISHKTDLQALNWALEDYLMLQTTEM